MRGGEVIRRARTRSGLSTADLAERLGITSSDVDAMEAGDPPFETVESAVTTCGRDLIAILGEPEPDPHDVSLIETMLSLSVEERVQRVADYVNFIHAGRAALRGTG